MDILSNFNVVYVISNSLVKESNKIPHLENRAEMVHQLIMSYNLLDKMKVVKAAVATEDELCTFHSQVYIDHLKSLNDQFKGESLLNEGENIKITDKDEFGIGYDCPILEDIYNFALVMAGGTLTAARSLIDRSANIAVNWCGGWHHAQREEAEGFCYINDIVLGIEKLRTVFNKILYIDLDVHHGNGVENAYKFDSHVYTLSFHKYEPGFYPGSGKLEDVGFGSGKYYCTNVPLKEGIADEPYIQLFNSIYQNVFFAFKPDAIVVQCGADCITGDHLGGFNLTSFAMGRCVQQVLYSKKPVLFLGGGGYNKKNVARCWTYLTAVILGCKLSIDIPENKYFTQYGPDFTLSILPSNRKDYNLEIHLLNIVQQIAENLSTIIKRNYTYLEVRK